MEGTKALAIRKKSRIHITILELFWIFLIGCVVGTLWEELLTLIAEHRFESRAGLVYGPFSPVYGLGAVLLTLILQPISDRPAPTVLLVGAIVGGAFEFLCSLMQQRVFGTISWDYSEIPLNIGGRTNIFYMLFWGAAGLLWLRFLPPILGLVHKIPHLRVLSIVLAVFMVINIAVSVAANVRSAERREGIAPSNALERLIDDRFPDERMAKIYPNAVAVQRFEP